MTLPHRLRLFYTVLLVCVCLLPVTVAYAQVRCATVEHTEMLYSKFHRAPQTEVFEKWMQLRKQAKFQMNGVKRTQAAPYTIPVVVHVIHNGEPLGIGTNISDEQVLSQINVLNEDFKRLNADANQTPSFFQPVAGSLDIQFVLARQDPMGAPTTGIVRKQGGKTSYVMSDDVVLKAQSYWPSENYFNIWVCNLSNLLGYAQFPVSNLEGLEEYQDEIAITDGVVISYDAFGSIDDGNFNLLTGFNKGRTLTHETGHFFGLRHIWGDTNSCTTTTDYVEDTPKQNDETTGCPGHPQTSCSSTKMFQNFMDYTHDPCMNIFTQGQIERMQIVLENSIRRVSLLNSIGLVAPSGGVHNVALRNILSPEPVSCATNNTLRIRFQNLGSNDLTYIKLSYALDNGTSVTSEHVLAPITPFGYGELSLPVSIDEGEHLLSVNLNSPNGSPDDNTIDNQLTKRIVINTFENEMPIRERFENSFTDQWTIINPYTEAVWQTTSTLYTQSIEFQAENTQQTESSWLVSPLLDFSYLAESHLRFDWSYKNNDSQPVTLQLKYSIDCGTTYVDMPGFSLYETSTGTNPTNEDDWDTRVINLEPLLGFDQVRLAFVSTSYLGNPLFLDNIELYVGEASPKLPLEDVVAIYPKAEGGIKLSFNVEEKQTVIVSIFDMMGRTIIYGVEPNTLNQTKTLELQTLQTGIYIVHMKVDNSYYSQKVFIQAQ